VLLYVEILEWSSALPGWEQKAIKNVPARA
jgi:hypothetical protein